MRDQTGQYRNASGESQNADNCLILETHPTLPRIGTDRSRNVIVWLRPKPRRATSGGSLCLGGEIFDRAFQPLSRPENSEVAQRKPVGYSQTPCGFARKPEHCYYCPLFCTVHL